MDEAKGHLSEKPIYPVGVAERLTGLTVSRIRYYEKAGLINPARSRGNHRLFSDRDIERLRLVCELMSRGLTTRAVRLVLEEGESFRV